MKRTFLYLAFIYLIPTLHSQNYMEVNDPQSWWNDAPGSIENLSYTVRPLAIYAEIQIAFDVRAENNFLQGTGIPLEFVMHFTMPEDVVFNDSWLWIEDYISKGEIYERYEGTQIYEDIVDRRQDPSILTKHSPYNYSLRIYPLDPDSTRRVKLSYLVPLKFLGKESYVDLPTHIFSPSADPIINILLDIHDNSNWTHYELGNEHIILSDQNGPASTYRIHPEAQDHLRIEFMPSDASKDFFFSHYDLGNEKFFQVAFHPSVELEATPSYNLVVVDFDIHHILNTTQDQLLNHLEHNLSTQFSDQDYINICYADFTGKFVFEEWTAASKSNIKSAITFLRQNGIDTRSRMEALLPAALDFIDARDNDASLFIVSSGTDLGQKNQADDFMEDIKSFTASMTVDVELSVLDFADKSKPTFWINGRIYRGNEYFYDLLTLEYGGLHFSTEFSDRLDTSLPEMFSTGNILISEYNFDIEATNGFAYAEFFSHQAGEALNQNQPLRAVGKYVGDYPFILEFQGVVNGQVFNQQRIVTAEAAMAPADWDNKIWYANYILHNEYSTANHMIDRIIEISEEQSLLCAHTIFLCLEPDTSAISSNSFENGQSDEIVGTDDLRTDSVSTVTIFPNPFISGFTIQLPSEISEDELILEIYSEDGRLLCRDQCQPEIHNGVFIIEWNRTRDLEPGMLLVRLISEKGIVVKKVLYIK